MRNIRFEDKCIIKRNIGKDEYDEVIQKIIYNGVCAYVEGGYAQVQRIFTRDPLVFLPTISMLCEANDSIEIETKFGRKLSAVVAIPREIELPMTRERFTRLELKQAT
jgi:hypothetical protein